MQRALGSVTCPRVAGHSVGPCPVSVSVRGALSSSCLAGQPLPCLPACLPACLLGCLRSMCPSSAPCPCSIPLRLSLTFSLLEGTMCAWVPPPPGNRAFYSFVAPPRLELTARPEVGQPKNCTMLLVPRGGSTATPGPTYSVNPESSPVQLVKLLKHSSLARCCSPALQLAGRLLKYSYHIARVSHWIEQRMRAAITRNMVFPGQPAGCLSRHQRCLACPGLCEVLPCTNFPVHGACTNPGHLHLYE